VSFGALPEIGRLSVYPRLGVSRSTAGGGGHGVRRRAAGNLLPGLADRGWGHSQRGPG